MMKVSRKTDHDKIKDMTDIVPYNCANIGKTETVCVRIFKFPLC